MTQEKNRNSKHIISIIINIIVSIVFIGIAVYVYKLAFIDERNFEKEGSEKSRMLLEEALMNEKNDQKKSTQKRSKYKLLDEALEMKAIEGVKEVKEVKKSGESSDEDLVQKKDSQVQDVTNESNDSSEGGIDMKNMRLSTNGIYFRIENGKENQNISLALNNIVRRAQPTTAKNVFEDLIIGTNSIYEYDIDLRKQEVENMFVYDFIEQVNENEVKYYAIKITQNELGEIFRTEYREEMSKSKLDVFLQNKRNKIFKEIQKL